MKQAGLRQVYRGGSRSELTPVTQGGWNPLPERDGPEGRLAPGQTRGENEAILGRQDWLSEMSLAGDEGSWVEAAQPAECGCYVGGAGVGERRVVGVPDGEGLARGSAEGKRGQEVSCEGSTCLDGGEACVVPSAAARAHLQLNYHRHANER